jgi:hypothetical protein
MPPQENNQSVTSPGDNTSFAQFTNDSSPQLPQPLVGGTPKVRISHNRRNLFILTLLVLLLLAGGGYVFAFYLPNSPNKV